MRNSAYYEAQVEVVRYPHNSDYREVFWIIIGRFNNEKDAKFASKLYVIADNSKVYITTNSTGNYRVKKVSCTQNHTSGPEYASLDEFIEKNMSVKLYSSQIGTEAMEKLLKEIGVETQEEKNLRIIEGMIMDYYYQININKNIPSMQEVVKDNREKVKFLEDLRDGKF